MQRYFINSIQINENIIIINNQDVHHIKNVMRMRLGDEVLCCDETEKVYLTKIIDIANNITLEIIKLFEVNNELDIQVTIAQGLVRRDKTEEVIRRLTELGCFEYIPVIMKRSIVKANNDKSDRMQKIIKEASEQSQRNRLMRINEIITFKELVKMKASYDLCLLAHVTEDFTDFKENIKNTDLKKVLVVVGPEGGFDNIEVEQLEKAGFVKISLGKRILRTETAPLYIMSVLSYEFGERK
jgi:16S rRNA (uracil1498-N3)-methyltransferase